MLTIHIGVMPDEFKTFKAQLNRFSLRTETPPFAPISDGDLWGNWGSIDPAGQDTSKPMHVQFITNTPQQDIHFLANFFEMFLIPMTLPEEYESKNPTWLNGRIFLTDSTEWIQEYEEFRW